MEWLTPALWYREEPVQWIAWQCQPQRAIARREKLRFRWQDQTPVVQVESNRDPVERWRREFLTAPPIRPAKARPSSARRPAAVLLWAQRCTRARWCAAALQ